jgi:uncharacterized protein (TIGR02594 family)
MKGVIGKALKYLDLHEVKDNKKLKKLFSKNVISIDPAKTAWCAAFIEAILLENKMAGTGKLTARSYLKWGNSVDSKDIEAGDIVVLKRGLLPWQGHVGFFLDWSIRGNVVLIGGNQSNTVCKKAYPRNKIIGIRRK